MRLFETKLDDLGERDLKAWRMLAAPNGRLISPYLLPEFAQMVHANRGDVRVLIAEEHSRPVGYFAYHTPDAGVVRPVGAPLSDYQGFACAPGFCVPEDEILSAIGASSLVYTGWHGAAPGKVRAEEASSVIDLRGGVTDWFARKRETHRKHFKKIAQRWRKAEREFGDVRIVFGDPLGERYAALRSWKRDQYKASGLMDLFDVTWIDALLHDCSARAFGPFRGLIASLYLGDQLAAVEMGLMAGGVYHSWMPAYDGAFRSVSPGLLLLHGVIEHAEKLNISRIDLGGGDYDYKAPYTDYTLPIYSGRALQTGLSGAAIKTWEGVEQICTALPGPFAQAPCKLRRRWAQTAAAEPNLKGRVKHMAAAFAKTGQRFAA